MPTLLLIAPVAAADVRGDPEPEARRVVETTFASRPLRADNRTRPLEISAVAIPADAGAQIRAAT